MSFEDPGQKRARPTQALVERSYPIRGPEARDVAIRRLSYRGNKAPTEYEIWREFRQFPDVLSAYFGTATKGELAEFEERFRYQREERERRFYGRVL